MTTTTSNNKSKHVFALCKSAPLFQSDLGSIHSATVKDLPLLKNLSMKRLILAPGAIREPHWHANCNKLAYCISGKVFISVLNTANEFSSFNIGPGQLFHIKTGSLHHIENIADEQAEIIMAFRHEEPEDFALSSSFGSMSDAVLGNTYDLKSDVFSIIRRNTNQKFLVRRQGQAKIADTANLPNSHKFDIEGARNGVKEDFGYAKQARSTFWPALSDIAMYSVEIATSGMREVHWHPYTAEMGYVHKGRARMSILDPDGSVDTYTLQPGDMYFIPAAYPHQIEVIGKEDVHFCIFFDSASPGDVGFRTSTTAFSREVLASTFEIPLDQLPEFPFTIKDPLLVARLNPLDL